MISRLCRDLPAAGAVWPLSIPVWKEGRFVTDIRVYEPLAGGVDSVVSPPPAGGAAAKRIHIVLPIRKNKTP